MEKVVRIATSCTGEKCCPVADCDNSTSIVKIHDPEKPERGSFEMTKDEWDKLIESAKIK